MAQRRLRGAAPGRAVLCLLAALAFAALHLPTSAQSPSSTVSL